MPEPADSEPVGSFLTGLLAGTIGRFAAEGLLRVAVADMRHPKPARWELDLETASGLRYRLDLHAITDTKGSTDAT